MAEIAKNTDKKDKTIKTDSLKKRYLFKLVTSFLIIPVNVLTISILTRMLGPGSFGDFKYLLYVFTILSGVIGFGSNFFSTELAKNHHDKTIISFYWTYILISWVVACIIIIPVLYSGLSGVIFPDQDIFYIWLAFFLTFLTFISSLLDSMSDTCGLTRKASIFNFFAKLAGIIVLCLFLYVFKWANLLSAFLYSYIAVFVLIVGFVAVLKLNGIPVLHFRISLYDFKQKFNSFYEYSHPLFVLAIVGIPLSLAGRWMLQKFGGSLQQGYFSLSDSFSAFIIIFSNSVTPLLLREFSISFKEKDINKMSSLFNKSISIFTAVSSYFSVFMALNASAVTMLVGGKSFEGAIVPTTIMLFYPIPYIANSILYVIIYATDRTALMRNVSVAAGVLGLLMTFIFVAPNEFYGLGLGAVGFAIAMVTVTAIQHLVLLKYSVSALNLKWTKVTGNYIKIISAFLVVGVASTILFKLIINDLWISFILSGMLYTFGIAFIVKRFPGLIGVSAAELSALVNPVLKKLRNG